MESQWVVILATITKRKQRFCGQIRRKGFAPISRTFASKQDAQEWALDEERKRISPRVKRLLLDPRKVTLREVLVRYLRDVTPSKISRETEHYRIAKIVRAPIADLSLFDLTPSVVAQFRPDVREFRHGVVATVATVYATHSLSVLRPAGTLGPPKNSRRQRSRQVDIFLLFL